MYQFVIKYNGLKIQIPFETNDFIFIPSEIKENNFKNLEELFTISHDPQFVCYIISKRKIVSPPRIDNIIDKISIQFLFLEALFELFFTNHVQRDLTFIFKSGDNRFDIDSIYKPLDASRLESPYPHSLAWKNEIIIYHFKNMIDTAFSKIQAIKNPEDQLDFFLRYKFCVDLYLSAKSQRLGLRSNSDLWMAMEILSSITIQHLLYGHEKFRIRRKDTGKELGFLKDKGKKGGGEIKEVISKFLEQFQDCLEIDCWDPLRPEFIQHVKNKINNHLPIKRKCLEVVSHFIKIEEIKVHPRKKKEHETEEEYEEFLKDYREQTEEFSQYQDEITASKLLNHFYDIRNSLFHSGKNLNPKWTLENERTECNFIKILEQLFFKVLDLDETLFFQMGYPRQYFYKIAKKDMENTDLSNESQQKWSAIFKHHIEPLTEKYNMIPFSKDYSISKGAALKSFSSFNSLIRKLKKLSKDISAFMQVDHPINIKDFSIIGTLKTKKIEEKVVFCHFGNRSGIFSILYAKKKLNFETDDTNFQLNFKGIILEDDVKYGAGVFVPILVVPPILVLKKSRL